MKVFLLLMVMVASIASGHAQQAKEAAGQVTAQQAENQPIHKPKLVMEVYYFLGCCNQYQVVSKDPEVYWVLHEAVVKGKIRTPDAMKSSQIANALTEVKSAERYSLDEHILAKPLFDPKRGTSEVELEALLKKFDEETRLALSTVVDLEIKGQPTIMVLHEDHDKGDQTHNKNKELTPRSRRP
jgi:hypothetical protein